MLSSEVRTLDVSVPRRPLDFSAIGRVEVEKHWQRARDHPTWVDTKQTRREALRVQGRRQQHPDRRQYHTTISTGRETRGSLP